MALVFTDLPEAATLPDGLRDHLPVLRSRWLVDGWRVDILAWSTSEWAELPLDVRPPDARLHGDLMVLPVLVGRAEPAS